MIIKQRKFDTFHQLVRITYLLGQRSEIYKCGLSHQLYLIKYFILSSLNYYCPNNGGRQVVMTEEFITIQG